MEFIHILSLFVIGLIAAFINVNAGGGSALTLPALIFLGLDSATANGTNRIAVILQNLSAVASFKKEKYEQFNLSIKLSLFTLPGSVIGAITAVKIGDELFQKILGIIMIAVTITMLLPQSKNSITIDNADKKLTPSTIIYFLLIGFYGGFIQVGIGFLLMIVLHKAMKFSLIYVNMHKVFIALFLTIPAFIIFIINHNVNWYWGLILALGNATGGWWAAKISVKKGDRFIRVIIILAILIMALKLIGIIL
ncbi:sulfite exporter TauE/SafE family protein [Melioribacteraceae bacterium 4301-Me]|uniref:sulfite exporter TauE/SafE family protein n=1 Tax=Pyranulibacter aquaticus TaxID=3163344 RepID=UPI00359B7035